MQPNYYASNNYTPVPPQPQGYQYQQSTNQPKPKQHNALVPVVILLLIALLGLGAYVVVDKFIFTPSETIVAEAFSSEIFNSLSSLSIANDDDYAENMALSLAGRLFTVNASADQTIKFTSSDSYEYTYYRDPSVDYRKIQSSTHHGKFSVDGEYIKLDSGDEFRIVGDYLVKSKDELSKNLNYVYFDNYQMSTMISGMNTALNSYFASMKKTNDDLPTTIKTHVNIDSTTCIVDASKLTNADSYYCSAAYIQYFDTELEIPKTYADFVDYCTNDDIFQIYSNGEGCDDNNSLQASDNLIVRITNHTNYRITGTFKN